ncbi:MAG: COG1649 predicted glycoside hydrolase, partial [uncultured Gemmatimonadaceae bacterium]
EAVRAPPRPLGRRRGRRARLELAAPRAEPGREHRPGRVPRRRLASPAGGARVPRGVGGDGGEHRLALAPGTRHLGAAGGAAPDPEPGGGAQPERGDPAGAPRGRRPLPVADRAVVGVPHRAAGAGAGAVLRPARLRGGRGASAGARAARVVQPVPRAAGRRPVSRRRDAPRPHAPRSRQAVRRAALDGPGRARRAPALAARDHRRGAAVRRGRRAPRRLLLPVPRAGPGQHGRPVPRQRELRALRAWRRAARARRLAAAQRRRVRAPHVRGREAREAVGEGRDQPVRHLAPGQSAADPGLRRVRRDLRGRAPLARERVGGLLHPAALLAGGADRAELPRAAGVVGGAERAGAAHLAGELHEPRRARPGRARRVGGAGDPRADPPHAGAARRHGQRALQHEGADATRRGPPRPAVADREARQRDARRRPGGGR